MILESPRYQAGLQSSFIFHLKIRPSVVLMAQNIVKMSRKTETGVNRMLRTTFPIKICFYETEGNRFDNLGMNCDFRYPNLLTKLLGHSGYQMVTHWKLQGSISSFLHAARRAMRYFNQGQFIINA